MLYNHVAAKHISPNMASLHNVFDTHHNTRDNKKQPANFLIDIT